MASLVGSQEHGKRPEDAVEGVVKMRLTHASNARANTIFALYNQYGEAVQQPGAKIMAANTLPENRINQTMAYQAITSAEKTPVPPIKVVNLPTASNREPLPPSDAVMNANALPVYPNPVKDHLSSASTATERSPVVTVEQPKEPSAEEMANLARMQIASVHRQGEAQNA